MQCKPIKGGTMSFYDCLDNEECFSVTKEEQSISDVNGMSIAELIHQLKKDWSKEPHKQQALIQISLATILTKFQNLSKL